MADLCSGQDLRELLTRKGIVHGIDQEVLGYAAACIDRAETLTGPLLLASGTPAVFSWKGTQPRFAPSPQIIVEPDENGQIRQVEIALVPLIRKGELLTEQGRPTTPNTGRNIFGQEITCLFPGEQVVEPGENVTVDEASQQLIATASGYPVFTSTRKESLQLLHISIDRLIRTTPDRMQALLTLKPAPSGQALPAQDTVFEILDEEQINFGRLKHAIGLCLERCASEKRPQTAIIALGSLPIKGKDAWLRFEMEVGCLPGKVMGNGEIDFRERNMFIGVNKDQLIAYKMPPSKGIPGRDIYGMPIDPMPGKDMAVRAMDDAALDMTTGEIRALRSGVLSMVTENSVKVCSRQVVAQDVDYETGNIFSLDALEIKGSIKSKFKVNALGDVVVSGDVEKAQLRSDSNVVVKGGLIGKLATIRARGDVDIHFVVHGRILSGGAIVLRQNASYCRLHTTGDLHCSPSSRIISSQLVAARSITAGTIGTDIADPSLLAAAVSPEQLQRFFELRRTVAEQAEAIETRRRRIGQDATCEDFDELIETHKESRKQFDALNLILPEDQKTADHGLSHALECAIFVKGKVFAGTEIRIGNSSMILPMTMSNVSFRLQDHAADHGRSRDIRIIPNQK